MTERMEACVRVKTAHFHNRPAQSFLVCPYSCLLEYPHAGLCMSDGIFVACGNCRDSKKSRWHVAKISRNCAVGKLLTPAWRVALVVALWQASLILFCYESCSIGSE
jgi:hypothetical protein